MFDKTVYFDNAATTKTDPRVTEAMLPYFGELFGNASGKYSVGFAARKAVEDARKKAAELINAEPDEIIFTSGGTESNNMVLGCGRWKKIITSKTEHESVLNPVKACIKNGTAVRIAEPDEKGFIVPDSMLLNGEAIERRELTGASDTLNDSPGLASVMYVNNETGTLQDIEALAAVVHEGGLLFHTDAVQAVGHEKIDVKRMGIDLLSASGHKFYGPKGIGFLYIRRGIKLSPLLLGGGQERNLRSGTENVPAIVGLGEACRIAGEEAAENGERERNIGRFLLERLMSIPGATHNGTGERILNLSFKGINGQSLAIRLDIEGICVSTGSACSSGKDERSHVLTAMGLTPEAADASIRLSIGRYNTMEEAEYAAGRIEALVKELRELTGAVY